MHGINSVRRASENITRQSLKAIEGLAGQSDMLRNISENLLSQISGVTGRFENQGQAILKAANSLESANFKIDNTLQNRHAELSQTLDRLSGKADEFGRFVGDYSTTMEGSLSEADLRARGELERMRAHTSAESERTLEDLRHRLTSVSTTMTTELGSLSNRFAATSEEMRQQASRAAAEIAAEQARLREQLERLPVAAHESSEGMRRALQDQIKALEQLSQLAARSAVQRDVIPPSPPLQSETMAPNPQPRPREQARSLTSLSSTIAQELGNRQRQRGPAPDNREGWSLGDLLARASRDEEGHGQPNAAAPARSVRRRPPSISTSKPSPARSIRPPPPPSGRGCAPASAASWCAASTATRAAPFSTISAIAAATTASCSARSAAISATSSASFRIRSARSDRPSRARPARLRHRPRLSVPRPRLRPSRLSAMALHGRSPAHRSHGRGMAACQAVRYRARRQDRGACRRGARRRRRLRGPRRMRSLCALRRDRRGRAACAARTARSAEPRTPAPICCRPARRATRSTARCGTSRPSARANAPGISPACRRRSRR